MTGPECLKLGILALQYINKKPVKNKECLLVQVMILQAFELRKWKVSKLLAQGHIQNKFHVKMNFFFF